MKKAFEVVEKEVKGVILISQSAAPVKVIVYASFAKAEDKQWLLVTLRVTTWILVCAGKTKERVGGAIAKYKYIRRNNLQ
jgi:hypothetical protein